MNVDTTNIKTKAQRLKYNRLHKKLKVYWLDKLQNADLNIFHKEQFNRDLNHLKSI